MCQRDNNKTENGNRECVKETTNRLKNKQQPKATNGSSIQREIPPPGGVLHLAAITKCILHVVQ